MSSVLNIDYDIFLNKAKRYCAYGERASYDVINKLSEWGASSQIIDNILLYLKENSFIDDERFLSIFVKSKFNLKKWGKRKISFHLISKGFSTDDISKHLDLLDDTYEEVLQSLIEKKVKLLKPQENNLILKQKLTRFCLSRGYDYATINKVLKKISF